MNWVLHHLPTTDSSSDDDINYKTPAYVIHSDDSESGTELIRCECQADLGTGQKVKLTDLLSLIQDKEFTTSRNVYRLKMNETLISPPTLMSTARYDPGSDQAIVMLQCKTSSCDNRFVWLQKTPDDVYYFIPQ